MRTARSILRALLIVFHVVAAGLILARFYLAHLEGLPLAIMVPGVLLAGAWLFFGVSYATGHFQRLWDRLTQAAPSGGVGGRS